METCNTLIVHRQLNLLHSSPQLKYQQQSTWSLSFLAPKINIIRKSSYSEQFTASCKPKTTWSEHRGNNARCRASIIGISGQCAWGEGEGTRCGVLFVSSKKSDVQNYIPSSRRAYLSSSIFILSTSPHPPSTSSERVQVSRCQLISPKVHAWHLRKQALDHDYCYYRCLFGLHHLIIFLVATSRLMHRVRGYISPAWRWCPWGAETASTSRTGSPGCSSGGVCLG